MRFQINSTFVKKSAPAGYINESGAYIGVFTKAKAIKSENSASRGIEFDFKANDDSVARRLRVWTHGKNGDYISGTYTINAMMACLRIKEINSRAGTCDEYNWDTKQTEKVNCDMFPDLMNKQIGVVLQREEYEGRDQYGDTVIRERMQIAQLFEASTRLTGVEIINSVIDPVMLDKFLKRLEMQPVKRLKPQAGQTSASAAPAPQDSISDDDIPF